MPVSLTVERLEKSFGAFAALRGVSLDVEPGELVALLGPSGSGKTTLLRAIAGLEQIESGRVLFDHVDATRLSLRERRIGFVFQHYALFRHLTVFENVAFGLRARPRATRPGEAEIGKRVRELLELVQIGGLERRFPAQLSGGQRQRVALARALAIEPRVLLLDEPFGALDAKVRKDLRRWLRELHARIGQTTLFVTHDQEEAIELADRVAILNNGILEQVGTPDDVYERPLTPFVCEFLGDANAIPVTISGGHAHFRGRPIYATGRNGSGEGALYVRPQHLSLVEPADSPLSGRVTNLRRNAGARRIEVAVEGLAKPLEFDVPAQVHPVIGELVAARVMRGHLFPAPSPFQTRVPGVLDVP